MRAAVHLSILLALGAVAVAAVHLGTGLPVPGGSDPDLWVLGVSNLRVDAPSVVPPLYPWLVGMAAWATGLGDLAAAGRVSAALAALAPAAAWGAARRLGASPRWAWLAAVAALLAPGVLVASAQAQPESLATLVFLAALLAGTALWARPGRGALAAAAAVAGLAPLAREHGPAILAGLAALGALAPGAAWDRFSRVAWIATAGLVAPELLGLRADLPWDQPWMVRVARTVAAATGVEDRSRSLGLPPNLAPELAELARSGPAGRLLANLRLAATTAPSEWSWLLLGVAAAPRRWRWPVVAALLPALATLPFFAQPRHVAVAVPAAAAAWAAGVAVRAGRARRLLLGAGAAATALGIAWAPARFARLRADADRTLRDLRLGEALCARVEPGDLAAGEPRAFLACPLPRTEPTRVARPGQALDAGDWRAWYASENRPGAGWTVALDTGDPIRFWRLPAPPGGRPCRDSRPEPGTPYFSLEPAPARMNPPCSATLDGEGGAASR